jgi:hypothetical protein
MNQKKDDPTTEEQNSAVAIGNLLFEHLTSEPDEEMRPGDYKAERC